MRARGSELPFHVEEVDALTSKYVGGIDEAGLGPLLGPLALGYVVFGVPDPGIDLWDALGGAVARSPDRSDPGRLVVADSKVLFDRTPRGEARLEACALAFLALAAASRKPPASAREMLARIPAVLHGDGGLFTERWIPFLPDRLPLHAGAEELTRSIDRIGAAAHEAGVEPVSAGMRIVPAAELNSSFASTASKGRTHWDLTAGILRLLWEEFGRDGLDLLVDRHGGRMRYEPLLRETFPEAAVTVILEEKARSAYSLRCAGDANSRRMRIVFAERAESASLAVAAASCLAKYARETCMRAFNAYFSSLQAGLRPTAGYVTDARRWLEEAGPAIAASGLARTHLVRDR
jgi:hypothetical protein